MYVPCFIILSSCTYRYTRNSKHETTFSCIVFWALIWSRRKNLIYDPLIKIFDDMTFPILVYEILDYTTPWWRLWHIRFWGFILAFEGLYCPVMYSALMYRAHAHWGSDDSHIALPHSPRWLIAAFASRLNESIFRW